MKHEMHTNMPELIEKTYNQEVASPELAKGAVTNAGKWKTFIRFFRSGEKAKIVELPMSDSFIRK
ncbi:MAG: hypothetical protein AB1Z18_10165 [Desulfobacterales bacterium]